LTKHIVSPYGYNVRNRIIIINNMLFRQTDTLSKT